MHIILLFISSIFLLSENAIEISNDYSGTWEYSVETPEGTRSGAIILVKEDEGYTGYIESHGSQFPLKDLSIDGTKLTCQVNVDGYPVDLKGLFKEDGLHATAFVEGFEIPVLATKRTEE